MKFPFFFQALLFLVAAKSVCLSQMVSYPFVEEQSITIEASSTYSSGWTAKNLINGSGLTGLFHDNDMSALTMWHSGINPGSSRAFPSLRTGRVWIRSTFSNIESIKELWIWNHNQPLFTSRGLKKVYIEYSPDGLQWNLLTDNEKEYWIIPEASGQNGEKPHLIVDFKGYSARYVVITADLERGNYGDEFYGLSEIRFIRNSPSKTAQYLDLKGTDQIINYTGGSMRKYNLAVPEGIAYGEDQLQFEVEEYIDTINLIAIDTAFHNMEVLLPFNGNYDQEQVISLKSLHGEFKRTYSIAAPRKWEIFLLPQSHVDIGYTHKQDEVKKLHFEFIEYAIELAEKTKNYPEGSRFVWNTEVLWAVKKYMAEKTSEEKNKLLDAIEKGWISLDATYSHINTSLCNSEQLFRLFSYANSLKQEYGLKISTAQQVDIPGMSWGIVSAMAQNGIQYMLDMPNVVEDQSLENHPFYWISPSGKEKILHFETYYYNLGYHLKGRYIPNYLSGNTKPYFAENPEQYFLDPFIFGYLENLKQLGYEYEMIPFAWIMTDNAPPDPDLPEVVRNWNMKYLNPRVNISSAISFFTKFEEQYHAVIPEMSGDYTEYWTDGVASGANETSINRNSAERILQLETLYAMFQPGLYDPGQFDSIWDNILLFTEHTWGSHLSIAEPENADVIKQWEVKSGYAHNARKQMDLLTRNFHRGDSISVVNTSSWNRSDIALISQEYSAAGDLVIDDKGDAVISQRLTSGELAVFAKDIPSFGYRRYYIKPGSAHKAGGLEISDKEIANEFFILAVADDSAMEIRNSRGSKILGEIFRANDTYYKYIHRTESKTDTFYAAMKSIQVKESGPLVASYQLNYSAPGCNDFAVEVKLLYQKDYLEVVNHMDKKEVRAKERGSINFPFDIRDAELSYEIPGGVVNRDTDILPGSNTRYYTVQRFVEVSNESQSFTLVSRDAPILKVQASDSSTNLESVVIDNNWHVNFRAYQEGALCFRYYIRSGNGSDYIQAGRLGKEVFQPLLALPSDMRISDFPLKGIKSDGIVTTSCKPIHNAEEFLVRIYNMASSPETGIVQVTKGSKIYQSNGEGQKLNEIPNKVSLLPHEFKTIIISTPYDEYAQE